MTYISWKGFNLTTKAGFFHTASSAVWRISKVTWRPKGRGRYIPKYEQPVNLKQIMHVLVTTVSLQLVKRITKNQRDPPSKATVSSKAAETGLHSDKRQRQKNALQCWDTHVAVCRRQQSFLSSKNCSRIFPLPVMLCGDACCFDVSYQILEISMQ